MLNPCFIGKHDTLELVERRLAGKAFRRGARAIGKRFGGPGPGADGGGASPVTAQMCQGVSPVPAQMWAGGSPVPAQIWPGASAVFGPAVPLGSDAAVDRGTRAGMAATQASPTRWGSASRARTFPAERRWL